MRMNYQDAFMNDVESYLNYLLLTDDALADITKLAKPSDTNGMTNDMANSIINIWLSRRNCYVNQILTMAQKSISLGCSTDFLISITDRGYKIMPSDKYEVILSIEDNYDLILLTDDEYYNFVEYDELPKSSIEALNDFRKDEKNV